MSTYIYTISRMLFGVNLELHISYHECLATMYTPSFAYLCDPEPTNRRAAAQHHVWLEIPGHQAANPSLAGSGGRNPPVGTHISFIFWGVYNPYNPDFGGIKPSFFHGLLGSKGS